MTISVPLAEPKTVDYIFIDENNRVHILLPVVGGDTIGLDNTCKTVIELQTFFYGQKELKDKEGAITQHRRPSALEVFAEYIKKIEQDINLLSKLGIYEKLLEEKKQRLEQMKQYVSLLSKVQDLYVNPTTEYPISPDEIHYLFKQQTNALTIHLSPETPDRFLNTSGPIFSLKRQEAHFYLQYNQQQFGVRPEGDVYDGFGPKLRAALREKLQEPSSVSSPKDTIIAEVTAHYEGQPKPSLKDLQDFTTTLIRQKNPEGLKNLDLTHYSDNQLIDESFFSDILGLSYDEILVSDAVDNLLGAALRNDEAFWSRLQPAKLIQPQAGVSNEKNAEDIAMAVQFFLASIAVHCKKEKIDASGLGPKLDQEASRIVRRIAAAVTNPNVSVEDELFNIAKSLISSFFNVFSKKLTKKDEEEIKKSFSGHYNLIKSSPHLDEFVFFLPEVQGDFFSHKNRISIPFIELINLSLTEGIRVGENGYINQPLQQQVAGSIKKVLATNSLQDNLTALKARTERKLDSNNLTPGSTFHYFLTTLTEDNYEKLTDFFCAQIKEPNDLVKQLSVDELSALFEHPLWEGMIARMCSSEDEQHSLYSTAIQRAYESVDRVNEKLVSPVGHEFNSQQINTQWDNAIRTIEDSARKYTSKLTYGLKSKERKDQVKKLEGLATQLSDKKEASPSEKIKTLIQVMSDLNHLSTEIDKEQPGEKKYSSTAYQGH